MRIRIHGGRLIDPANGIDDYLDLFIAEGRIVSVGAAPDGFRAEREIDASQRIVCPGLVDLAARLREPGQEHKATIASEARAAAAGGVTTLCVPPDTQPVIDTPAVAELIQRHGERAGKVRLRPIGALTQGLDGEQLSEMAALKEAGCVAVGNALRPLVSTRVLRRTLEYAATHDLTVFLQPLDHSLADGGCAHEGAVASRLGLPGIPSAAETVAVARDLAMVDEFGVRVHFCRLSSGRAVDMIRRARDEGLPVSADVAAHQLHLCEDDITDFNSQCHLLPPLRTAQDREQLREAVAANVVDSICSDHQPHEADAKLAPFPATEPGISAIETLLPLTLALVGQGMLTLPEAIARLTTGPARTIGVGAGTLTAGRPADVCIFDPDAEWTVRTETLLSQGHNTPFLGRRMKGRVCHTLLGGRSVFERLA